MDPRVQALQRVLLKLPGIGERTARRLIRELLAHRSLLRELRETLEAVDRHLSVCERCGGYTGHPPLCEICQQEDRLPVLVVVSEPEDVWSLDALAPERYRYHVLGGVLNALEGVGPESLNLEPLRERIPRENIQEVVLALGGTFEEQTTAYFLLDWLHAHVPGVRISRIAVGLPMGREVGQADEETLREALIHRQPFDPEASS